jgi:hypothetical protein
MTGRKSVTATVGYSGTPLARKLGIRGAQRIMLLGAPESYVELLKPLPEGVVFEGAANRMTDIAQIFVTEKAKLTSQLRVLRRTLRTDAAVWVSWPKKASKVATDITEDTIREVSLPLGFVDIKVCAVTEVWSGLKLVVRKELR